MLILTFKCLKNICPDYLCNKFNFVHDNHDHVTRNHSSNTLTIPKFSSNSGKRTFVVRAGYLWNTVSPTIRSDFYDMSIGQFKSRVIYP